MWLDRLGQFAGKVEYADEAKTRVKSYAIDFDKPPNGIAVHVLMGGADASKWDEHPERDAMRQKFLSEHKHGDDEVRFFVEGAGAFYLRDDARVLKVVCEQGDLLSVPKHTRHWFDMGPRPLFAAIRLFTTPDGWVAEFTGDKIAGTIPGYDPAKNAA